MPASSLSSSETLLSPDQVYCTDQARNDFWELAGGLPVNARSRGRLGLRLALAGAEPGARGVEPGLIRPETRVACLWPKALRATIGHTLS